MVAKLIMQANSTCVNNFFCLIDFEEVLPELKKVIESCSFLCVDGEFTGLNEGKEISPYETPQDYYEKLRTGALDFLFVQFGLAAFSYNCRTKRYNS